MGREHSGMNTMRVFLHNLLWEQDPEGIPAAHRSVSRRLRRGTISGRCLCSSIPAGIRTRNWGRNIHRFRACTTPGWVQAPGAAILADPTQVSAAEEYVEGVVGAFANDPRILAWDLWNEPDNGNDCSYLHGEPKNKNEIIAGLLPQVFAWARSAHPTQPLTSGVWHGDWTFDGDDDAGGQVQIEQSDVISFHNYGWPEDFEAHVKMLLPFHRPLICTEYMARSGSTFDTVLPLAKKYHVGAINWGLVAGKSQT